MKMLAVCYLWMMIIQTFSLLSPPLPSSPLLSPPLLLFLLCLTIFSRLSAMFIYYFVMIEKIKARKCSLNLKKKRVKIYSKIWCLCKKTALFFITHLLSSFLLMILTFYGYNYLIFPSHTKHSKLDWTAIALILFATKHDLSSLTCLFGFGWQNWERELK